MKTNTYARVQVTVEINVNIETWTEQSTIEQIEREAREWATKRITELCQRYVRLIDTPKIEAIITRKENAR